MQVIDYHEAIFASELTTNARLTALAISKFYNWKEQKACWPSNKTLAKATGLSIRSIIRAKNELINSGYLKSERRFNDSSVYVTLTPCHTVATPMTQWQPNNEVNNEVNNEIKVDSFQSSTFGNDINNNTDKEMENVWRIFEEHEGRSRRHNSGGGRNIRQNYKRNARDTYSDEEVARFNKDMAAARLEEW